MVTINLYLHAEGNIYVYITCIGNPLGVPSQPWESLQVNANQKFSLVILNEGNFIAFDSHVHALFIPVIYTTMQYMTVNCV